MEPIGEVDLDIDAFSTVEEVAVQLGVSVATVRRWCGSGRLTAHKVGKEWLIHRASLRGLGAPRVKPQPTSRGMNVDVALRHVVAVDLRDRDIGIPDVLRFQDHVADREALLQDASLVLSGEGPLGPTIEVELPKSSFFTRTTQLLTMEDRIAYQAVVASFAREVDRTLLPTVFGGRLSDGDPTVFLRDGVKDWHAWRRAVVEQLKAGDVWMIKTDVTAYFDTIQHSLLLSAIEAVYPDEHTLQALRRMLRHWAIVPGVGIPQGPNASRFLQNAYFYPVDHVMAGGSGHYFRYVDDVRIVANSRAEAMAGLKVLERECRRRGLVLSAHKTRLLHGAAAMEEFTNKRFETAQYHMDAWNHDSAKKILREIVRASFAQGDANIEVRPVRFGLWRLLLLHDTWARDRILERLQDLAPVASLVALYLTVWADKNKIEEAVASFLLDPERNTSPYLAAWLMAMLLERRNPPNANILRYARTTAKDRNQPVYLRVLAANVLATGRLIHDVEWLRSELRNEFDPYVVRGYLVALARIKRLDPPSIARASARVPAVARTVKYLRGRTTLPSLVHWKNTIPITA